MSIDLPYFKFHCDEWLTGDISLERMNIQGIFINICAYYWKKDCNVKIAQLKRRYGSVKKAQWDYLFSKKYLKVFQNDSILITFLLQQFTERVEEKSKKSLAGTLGAKKRWHNHNTPNKVPLTKHGNKEVEVEVDKRKDKSIIIKPDWRNNYKTYKQTVLEAQISILNDSEEMEKQQEFNPNLNIELTLKKAVHNYWGTETGWKKKKSSRSANIDMRRTLITAISMQSNKVYKPHNEQQAAKVGLPEMPKYDT